MSACAPLVMAGSAGCEGAADFARDGLAARFLRMAKWF